MLHKNNEILVRLRENGKLRLVDKITDATANLSFLERLFRLENRLEFDYTCRTLTELLYTNPKWGIDSYGKIFNLSRKQRFPARYLKVVKHKDNLVWLEGISYPFKVDSTIELSFIDWSVLTAVVAYIDEEWTLLYFDYNVIEEPEVSL